MNDMFWIYIPALDDLKALIKWWAWLEIIHEGSTPIQMDMNDHRMDVQKMDDENYGI